jgi:hypothetical protein
LLFPMTLCIMPEPSTLPSNITSFVILSTNWWSQYTTCRHKRCRQTCSPRHLEGVPQWNTGSSWDSTNQPRRRKNKKRSKSNTCLTLPAWGGVELSLFCVIWMCYLCHLCLLSFFSQPWLRPAAPWLHPAAPCSALQCPDDALRSFKGEILRNFPKFSEIKSRLLLISALGTFKLRSKTS